MRSRCKINLCLEILGRRGDGFHELRTVFQTVSLADELTIEVGGDGIRVRAPEGGAPEGPENLCWQAAEAYRELRGWPDGASITLRKRVPSGAGLGGGSSNAAATLVALAELDEQPPAADELKRIAAKLGSDIAFFLEGGTALGSGRGEQIERLPAAEGLNIVLAMPDLHVSTGEAYGLLAPGDFTDGSRVERMAEAIRRGADASEIATHIHNGFRRAVTQRWSAVADALRAIDEAGAMRAEISGSGAACFGLFADETSAAKAAEELAGRGMWAVSAEAG
jgi:4-diphosphocytidyl-2-C-methyl-D-erythritol kinase